MKIVKDEQLFIKRSKWQMLFSFNLTGMQERAGFTVNIPNIRKML